MARTLTKEVKSLFKSFRSPTPESLHRPDAVLKHADITGNTTESFSAAQSPTSLEQPILIELFQSQGCNSCPPTNDNLISFVQSHQSSQQSPSPPRFYASRSPSSSPTAVSNSSPGPEYLLLTYQVTYWNYLGWEDTFSLPINDIRQREYVRRMGLRGAYTPMVVVNGRGVGVGNTRGDFERILRDGQKSAGAREKVSVKSLLEGPEGGEPVLEIDATNLPPSYSQSAAQHLEVWEIAYIPTSQDVHIPRGENAGRTLPHLNVVRDVRRMGSLERGEKARFQVPRHSDRRASLGEGKVVIVQDGKGGGICGILRI
ncbi:uncharacterized protein Z519_12363 [Cladophialophora bantiana CBS 173.52]|uniref:DUF1223-domain-containing protein n=1 Tax=Cladophialophora bantiana (strain ATCC 10958 / CBS 173.52 / CDC B-1940 / NIH 8579) TaxID=1442370 RepID=A0A0D2EAE8_CLAB1|nr:uncharacterized protein Z519_12363 [Cladophialophora bantiana CBS 173.52]KIW87066.1 hypothetical protein Z519_12363 [Cladophialophora bantiana CBS 173.52]